MKTGRNDFCPCGSGKKYKKCCLNKPEEVLEKPAASPEEKERRKEITSKMLALSSIMAIAGVR